MMALALCARYEQLRQALEQAGTDARVDGQMPDDTAACRLALTKLRSHAEDCQECIEALFGAFPETVGKQRRMVSLLQEDKS